MHHPIFIIVLEAVFHIIKKSNIEGFEIFRRNSSTLLMQIILPFFHKNTEPVINLLEIFKHFSHFCGLKQIKWKCEIADIGVKG